MVPTHLDDLGRTDPRKQNSRPAYVPGRPHDAVRCGIELHPPKMERNFHAEGLEQSIHTGSAVTVVLGSAGIFGSADSLEISVSFTHSCSASHSRTISRTACSVASRTRDGGTGRPLMAYELQRGLAGS